MFVMIIFSKNFNRVESIINGTIPNGSISVETKQQQPKGIVSIKTKQQQGIQNDVALLSGKSNGAISEIM